MPTGLQEQQHQLDCAPVRVAELPREALEEMSAAGGQIQECLRLLAKHDDNVVSEILRGHEDFYEWDHYPPGDVYDRDTHAQYYYHAHGAGLRGDEHGHFHTFLRLKGIPDGISPAPRPGDIAGDIAGGMGASGEGVALPDKTEILSHLIGISVDKFGEPIGLFSTNRWVTDEVWYTAEDVIRMLDCFAMDLAYPSLPVNVWITAMLRLFRPEIEVLLRQRDMVVGQWQANKPESDVWEDRDLEITSSMTISVDVRLQQIADALARTD